jgi:hypothetical protein
MKGKTTIENLNTARAKIVECFCPLNYLCHSKNSTLIRAQRNSIELLSLYAT